MSASTGLGKYMSRLDDLIRGRSGVLLAQALQQETHMPSSPQGSSTTRRSKNQLCKRLIQQQLQQIQQQGQQQEQQYNAMCTRIRGILNSVASQQLSTENVDRGWKTLVVHLMMATVHSELSSTVGTTTANSSAMQAYKEHEDAVRHFSRSLFTSDPSTSWLCPVAQMLTRRLVQLATTRQAMAASSSSSTTSASMAHLEDTVRLLQGLFNLCINDRTPSSDHTTATSKSKQSMTSKRSLLLHLITLMFRVYFRLNTLRLCHNLIRSTTLTKFPPMHTFPMSQRVTYAFYTGRIAMFEGRFEQARDDLQWCYTQCTAASGDAGSGDDISDAGSGDARSRNRTTILQYLVCINAVLGRYPSERTMQRLLEDTAAGTMTATTTTTVTMLRELCSAVQRGHLATFDTLMTQHRGQLIRSGTYLIWERARIVAYRNLVRRTVLLLLPQSTRIDMHAILVAVRYSSGNVEQEESANDDAENQDAMDEVEGMLCTMIYRGFLRGYLSHTHRKLVVPKTGAFPKITGDQHKPVATMLGATAGTSGSAED